jgi:spore maturation protein CgeB
MKNTVENASDAIKRKYACDISFIGNFYNGSNNRIKRALNDGKFDEYTEGYINALIKFQQLIPESNIIKASLIKDVVDKVTDICELSLSEKYIKDDFQKATDAIGVEVSRKEREEMIELIARDRELNLYTSSKLEFNTGKLINKGFADNLKEVPLIYNSSKINLNMTSTNITSGIPLRVFDILSCGGFCITNYREEIAELFTDGEDLAIYYDKYDMIDKIGFYLSHEEERTRIAENGHKKAITEYNIDNRLKSLFYS